MLDHILQNVWPRLRARPPTLAHSSRPMTHVAIAPQWIYYQVFPRTRRDPTLRTSDVNKKVRPLHEAVSALIRPGDMLSLAFGDARPNAIIREIVRSFRGTSPRFTVVCTGLLNTQQSLIGAGLVSRLVTTYAGENYPAPQPSPVVQRALESTELELEDWSIYALVASLAAGALQIPFLPVRSFADGSMSFEGSAQRAVLADPFGGSPVTVVPALSPDICLVHGVLGDAHGNIALAGPLGEREWGALASRRGVIATVEKIVGSDVLRQYNHVVRIPGELVTSISEAPRGSHPYGVFTGPLKEVAGYDEDAAYMLEVRRAMRTADSFDSWMDRWLASPWPESCRSADLPDSPAPGVHDYSASELMIVSAARRLAHRCRDANIDYLLAGIGQANLAAWLARDLLSDDGETVGLLAEMGMVGYEPQAGDPYIFANRNKPHAAQLTDTMAVLGSYVGHPRLRTLAAVGAGQVDAHGNINSSMGANGRRLTGSGGVNDIASVAFELLVVLKHSRSRLVDEVGVVTAPGRAVRTIVTDRSVFERHGDRFALTHVLRPADRPGSTVEELVSEVRASSGWTDVDWPRDVVVEPPPSALELARLRSFDPHRYFLR